MNDLEKRSNAEFIKLHTLDKYRRRQNVGFKGVHVTENEDLMELVLKISRLVGFHVTKNDV